MPPVGSPELLVVLGMRSSSVLLDSRLTQHSTGGARLSNSDRNEREVGRRRGGMVGRRGTKTESEARSELLTRFEMECGRSAMGWGNGRDGGSCDMDVRKELREYWLKRNSITVIIYSQTLAYGPDEAEHLRWLKCFCSKTTDNYLKSKKYQLASCNYLGKVWKIVETCFYWFPNYAGC